MDVYFYMTLLDSVSNAVLTANFFINILELKYINWEENIWIYIFI